MVCVLPGHESEVDEFHCDRELARDAAGRWANKLDQIEVRRPGPAGSVPILLDDVTTTGASLAAAARALGRAGTPVLGAVVVAATIRRTPPSSG